MFSILEVLICQHKIQIPLLKEHAKWYMNMYSQLKGNIEYSLLPKKK